MKNTWPTFKEYVYGISSEVLCFMENEHKDRVDDNDVGIEDILQEKWKAILCLLWDNLLHDERQMVTDEIRDAKNKVKRRFCHMKDK